MRNVTVEKVLLVIMAVVLVYVTVSTTKVIEQQQKCMQAMVSDLLSGNIIGSQVSCSGAIK